MVSILQLQQSQLGELQETVRRVSTEVVICQAALRRAHIADHSAVPGSIPDWYLQNQSALLADLRRAIVCIEKRLNSIEAFLWPPPPALDSHSLV